MDFFFKYSFSITFIKPKIYIYETECFIVVGEGGMTVTQILATLQHVPPYFLPVLSC